MSRWNSLLFVWAAWIPIVGCGTPEAEHASRLTSGEEGSEFTVTVDVPEAEAASVGSYQGSVVYPDGSVFEISGDRDGSIAGKWLINLGGNEYPELIIWMVGSGSRSYATVHLYWMTADGPRFEDATALPQPAQDGYMGHDSVFVANHQLKRCFPVYQEDDTNARPTGTERCMVYNSMMGWVL